jgi:DNA-directed RNA polymerase specialized sigma24 family protein
MPENLPGRQIGSFARQPGTSKEPEGTGSEVALLRRIADGRIPALGAFYDLWADRLYSTVLRLVEDTDDAEQVVEATLWYAWKNASEFDETHGSVGEWLAKIVRRQMVDQLRLRRQMNDTLRYLMIQPRPIEIDLSRRHIRQAIPQADTIERLRQAVEAAALADATSINALRAAVREYTVSLREEGHKPEDVLIRLKTMIQNRNMPPGAVFPSDWHGSELRQKVSTWSIEEFFQNAREQSTRTDG